MQTRTPPPPPPRDPPTLPRSLVLLAISGKGPEAREALGALYDTYRRPMLNCILDFGRSRSWSGAHAEDLMHKFLVIRLDKRDLKGWDPKRTRFRYYLLGALRNFLRNEVKSPDHRPPVSIDEIHWEPSHDENPARIQEARFARECARALVQRSFARLRKEYETRSALFHALVPYLPKSKLRSGQPPYPELSRELEKSQGALRADMYKMRELWEVIVRDEVAQTVLEDEVDDEMHCLLRALESSESD
jgi:DNA-directed RNA polymerase specialized sigma24 family protein